MQKITVGIVEDNAQLGQDIRDKLALSDEVEVVFEVCSGQLLLEILATGTIPEVLLMDVAMPEMNGIEATLQAKQRYPDLKIVMLTVMDDEQKLFEALQAGASGYLLKDAKPHQLLNAINDVLEGSLPLSPTLASRVLGYLKGEKVILKPPVTAIEVLSKREKEVLECLKRGLAVKQISEELFIANKTVTIKPVNTADTVVQYVSQQKENVQIGTVQSYWERSLRIDFIKYYNISGSWTNDKKSGHVGINGYYASRYSEEEKRKHDVGIASYYFSGNRFIAGFYVELQNIGENQDLFLTDNFLQEKLSFGIVAKFSLHSIYDIMNFVKNKAEAESKNSPK